MSGVGLNSPEHYRGTIDIVYDGYFQEGVVPNVSITTDHYILRPVTNKSSVVTFYEKHLFGNKKAMNAVGLPMSTLEGVRERVDEYVQKWRSGDPYSAFVVYDKVTSRPLAHTIISIGYPKGQGSYGFLVGSEAPSEIRPKSNSHAQFDEIQLTKEVIYAMFQGWAPWLAKNQLSPDLNRAPLQLIATTFYKDSVPFKILTKMVSDSLSSRVIPHHSTIYTYVDDMAIMRRRLSDETPEQIRGNDLRLEENLSQRLHKTLVDHFGQAQGSSDESASKENLPIEIFSIQD